MTTTAAEVLRRYCDAMEVGTEGCIAQMAEDIVFHSPCVPPPIPKLFVGRDSVAQVFEVLFTKLFKEYRWDKLEILGTEDPAIAVAKATSKVVLLDGRDYSNDYAFWCRVKDGKIVEHIEYMDGYRAAAAFEGLL